MTFQWVNSDAHALANEYDEAELERRGALGLRILEASGQRIPLELVDLYDWLIPEAGTPTIDKTVEAPSLENYRPSQDLNTTSRQSFDTVDGETAPHTSTALGSSSVGKIATSGDGKNAPSATGFGDLEGEQFQGVDAVRLPSCAVAGLNPLCQPAKSTTTNTPKKARKQTAKPTFKPITSKSKWKTAKPEDKLAASVTVAERHGGLAFTLNLSPKVEETLSKGKDPARQLSHYIAREMRKALGYVVPHSFCFEFSPDGRLHVHGVLVFNAGDEALKSAVKKTLMRAGGKLDGRSASRQCSFEKLDGADGWTRYILAEIKRTRDLLGTEKAIFISSEMLRLTRTECGESGGTKG